MATERKMLIAHGREVRYCIIGELGAIDFHCAYPEGPYAIAGLEMHYRARPTYMPDRPADFDACQVLGGPCWCDGTSLYATERLLPLYRDYALRARGPEDEECWWRTLEEEYQRRFDPREVSFSDERSLPND